MPIETGSLVVMLPNCESPLICVRGTRCAVLVDLQAVWSRLVRGEANVFYRRWLEFYDGKRFRLNDSAESITDVSAYPDAAFFKKQSSPTKKVWAILPFQMLSIHVSTFASVLQAVLQSTWKPSDGLDLHRVFNKAASKWPNTEAKCLKCIQKHIKEQSTDSKATGKLSSPDSLLQELRAALHE